jgi:hypothetical protein
LKPGETPTSFSEMDVDLKKWIEKAAADLDKRWFSNDADFKDCLRKSVDAEADRRELNDNDRFEAQDYALQVTSGKDISKHVNPPRRRARDIGPLLRWK